MLVQDIRDVVNGRIIMKDGRTVDQIYKGFQIYKSGKAPAEFTAIKETKQYEGLLDDVKRQIDKYWEKKDAEVVLKRKNAGDRKPKHPRWRIKGDRHSVRDASPEEEKVKQYISSIHNPSKRKYAEEYFHYEQGRSQQPKRPSDLSAMGAQAVEMRIQQLLEGGVSDQAPVSRQSAVKMNVGGKKCPCGGQFVQSSVEELSGGRKKRTEKCDKCGRSQIIITDRKTVTDALDPDETHDIRDIEKETGDDKVPLEEVSKTVRELYNEYGAVLTPDKVIIKFIRKYGLTSSDIDRLMPSIKLALRMLPKVKSVRDASPEEEKVKQYISSIHNPSKRKYAEEYFHYEQGRSQQPKRPSDLSAMGAQAVEMRIQQLLEGGVSDQAPVSRQSAVKMNVGGKKCPCGGQFVQSSVEELSGGRKKRTEKCDKCGRSQIIITDRKTVTDALDPDETHDIRDIEKEAKANDYFRKVVFTAERMQLVVMCLKPGEDIGEEVHPTTDQFFRIEEGEGKAIVDGREINIKDGSSILIKSGRVHNIINDSNKPLKLYSLYSPPHHRDGLIQKEK